jgi:hypothetical protein
LPSACEFGGVIRNIRARVTHRFGGICILLFTIVRYVI